jgi:hypothetical protein
MAKARKIITCNSFYDIIADDYNSQLTESDNKVRKVVSLTFKRYVKQGNVLDFGGGTGLDLSWLLEDGYSVFFLEPSVNMRSVAKKNLFKTATPAFIEDNTDFSKWSPAHLPFNEKVEGVLANFAVLNCIKNIDEFFRQVALLCDHNCFLIATVIDSKKEEIHDSNPIGSTLRNFFNKEEVIYNNYNGVGHKTFVYTLKQLKAASAECFNFISYTPVEASVFAVLILSKK